MKISIRKSKYQKEEMTKDQLIFANACILRYVEGDRKTYYTYKGDMSFCCDVYSTKTQISAVVYYLSNVFDDPEGLK